MKAGGGGLGSTDSIWVSFAREELGRTKLIGLLYLFNLERELFLPVQLIFLTTDQLNVEGDEVDNEDAVDCYRSRTHFVVIRSAVQFQCFLNAVALITRRPSATYDINCSTNRRTVPDVDGL